MRQIALDKGKILHLIHQNQIKMRKPLAWILLIFSAFQMNAQNNYIACGEQSGTWNYDTVFVNCDVVVPHLQELQLTAGTKVIFTGHYAIHVQGSIKALGQFNDSIFFTVADTTGFGDMHSNAGGWNGLRFEDTPLENDSSIFNYCVFQFGKAVGDSVNCFGGAIRALRSDKIAIRNSRLSDNFAFYWGGALYAFKTNVLMEHCRLDRNFAGNDGMIYGYGGAICYVSSEPDLRFLSFKGNVSTGIGGAASFEYSRPLLLNAIFQENASGLGGALGFLRSEPNRPIANLLIANNTAQFFGGGIANVAASPVMTNITIVDNFASMGGGLYCNEVSNAHLYNSVLWGNSAYDTIGSQVWIWDVVSEPGFYHCNVQAGLNQFGGSTFIGVYENCTEADPQFTDPQNGFYTISPTGSCANAGINAIPDYALPEFDLLMHARINQGVVDIGAYEYHGPTGLTETSAAKPDCKIYPLPANETSRLQWANVENPPQHIELIDPRPIVLFEHQFQSKPISDEIQLSGLWSGFGKLPSGWYSMRIRFANGQQTVLVVVK
jgi:hypothetical protein